MQGCIKSECLRRSSTFLLPPPTVGASKVTQIFKKWTFLQKLLTMQRWVRTAAKQVEPSTALKQKQTKALLGQSPRRCWPWPNPAPPDVYTKRPITIFVFHLPYTVSPTYSCSCSLQRLLFHLRILTFKNESNRTQVSRRVLLIH